MKKTPAAFRTACCTTWTSSDPRAGASTGNGPPCRIDGPIPAGGSHHDVNRSLNVVALSPIHRPGVAIDVLGEVHGGATGRRDAQHVGIVFVDTLVVLDD